MAKNVDISRYSANACRNLHTGKYMLIVSIVTALGYAAWNVGIIKGNITILVALSYFSPIFSSVISMFIFTDTTEFKFLAWCHFGDIRFAGMLDFNQLATN